MCNGLCVCVVSFSTKLRREEVEQLKREVDLLKSKLSEFRVNVLTIFLCYVFKKILSKMLLFIVLQIVGYIDCI